MLNLVAVAHHWGDRLRGLAGVMVLGRTSWVRMVLAMG